MKMSNQACQCPGLKIGHQKKTIPPHYNPKNTEEADNKKIIKPNYVGKPNHSEKSMHGFFRLPDYEPTKLQSLPATQQNLFRREELLGMLEDFSKQMHQAINQNRIQVPPSIELGLNHMGSIFAEGGHPQQWKIEKLFNITPLLEEKFHQIAFTSRVQQLADLQPSFRGEFFKLSPHSGQQITLVHMRAIELQPFRLVISRMDEPSTAVNDKQHKAEPSGQRPTKNRPEASPPVHTEPHKEERRHVHKGKLKCIINS